MLTKGEEQTSPFLITENSESHLKGVIQTQKIAPSHHLLKGGVAMKGYHVPDGYVGFVPWLSRWILFATEADYREYLEGEP